MKITDVEAIHVRIQDDNIGIFDGSYDDCVIVVRTDDGREGIGECESLAPAIQAIINADPAHSHAWGLKKLLVGRELNSPSELWNLMYDSTDYIGRRGLMMHALGGVGIALWDLAGQAAGKPIYELLGGKRRDRVEAYGTIYPMARKPEEVYQQVKDAAKKNLKNFKLCADSWWLDDLKTTEESLRAAREAAGPDAKILIDSALSYKTAEEGLRLYPIYKEIGIWFHEAPLPLDDIAGHAEMAGHGIPLGVGDLGFTHVDEFIDAMDRGRCTVCQTDITMVGGFDGLKKISAAAEARGKRVVTHGYKTNITIAANLHFLCWQPREEVLEYSTSLSPLRWEMTKERIPVAEDGTVAVSNTPGLGVKLDWDFVNKHRVR